MAADDEQVGVVLVYGVAEHVPRLSFHHLYQTMHLRFDMSSTRRHSKCL